MYPLIKDPKCLECTFNAHFRSKTTSAIFSAISLCFDHTPFISILIGISDIKSCSRQGRRTRSGRSGYGLTTFFLLCSEKYLQVVRVCNAHCARVAQLAGFVPTASVTRFMFFFHSKMAQNAPEFTSECLKKFLGEHAPRPH